MKVTRLLGTDTPPTTTYCFLFSNGAKGDTSFQHEKRQQQKDISLPCSGHDLCLIMIVSKCQILMEILAQSYIELIKAHKKSFKRYHSYIGCRHS